MSDKSFSAFRATGAPLSADTVGLAKLATGPTPGNRDLGLHAVEGVDEYLSGLQHPSCADFDATVFSVLTVGRELKERKWGQHK